MESDIGMEYWGHLKGLWGIYMGLVKIPNPFPLSSITMIRKIKHWKIYEIFYLWNFKIQSLSITELRKLLEDAIKIKKYLWVILKTLCFTFLNHYKIFANISNCQDMGSLFWGICNKKIDFSQCLSEVADSSVSEESGAWVAGRSEPGAAARNSGGIGLLYPGAQLTISKQHCPNIFWLSSEPNFLCFSLKRNIWSTKVQGCPVKVMDVFWAWLTSMTLGFSFWVACRLASITIPFWNDFEGYCWFQGTHCLPKPCSRKRDGREAERYNLRDWEIRQT